MRMCRYSDHGALSLSPSKDFLIAESTCVFCVAVAVKKPLRRPWFFPHLLGYRAGSEPCRSGSVEWRIPWQIYWRHLRRAEVTGRMEVQDASLISLLALTCNRVRSADWHGAHELVRSEGGYPAFATAMPRRCRKGFFYWRVFFSLRTSSFPARRKSSSALSRAGNDRGLMTSTVSVPLFGHQAGVNGLTGQRVFVLFFLLRQDGYSPSCRSSARSRNGTPFLLSLHSSSVLASLFALPHCKKHDSTGLSL